MRAVVASTYGAGSEVLSVVSDYPRPELQAGTGDVLIRAHACSLSPGDYRMLKQIESSVGTALGPARWLGGPSPSPRSRFSSHPFAVPRAPPTSALRGAGAGRPPSRWAAVRCRAGATAATPNGTAKSEPAVGRPRLLGTRRSGGGSPP